MMSDAIFTQNTKHQFFQSKIHMEKNESFHLSSHLNDRIKGSNSIHLDFSKHLLSLIHGNQDELLFFDNFLELPPNLSLTRFSSLSDIFDFLLQCIQKPQFPHVAVKAIKLINIYVSLDGVDLTFFSHDNVCALFVALLSSPEKNIARYSAYILANCTDSNILFLFYLNSYDIFEQIKCIVDPESPDLTIFTFEHFLLMISNLFPNITIQNSKIDDSQQKIDFKEIWELTLWILHLINDIINDHYIFSDIKKVSLAIFHILSILTKLLQIHFHPVFSDESVNECFKNIWRVGPPALDSLFAFLCYDCSEIQRILDILLQNNFLNEIIQASHENIDFLGPLIKFFGHRQEIPNDGFISCLTSALKLGNINVKKAALQYIIDVDDELNDQPSVRFFLIQDGLFGYLADLISVYPEETLFIGRNFTRVLFAHDISSSSLHQIPNFDSFYEEMLSFESSIDDNDSVEMMQLRLYIEEIKKACGERDN